MESDGLLGTRVTSSSLKILLWCDAKSPMRISEPWLLGASAFRGAVDGKDRHQAAASTAESKYRGAS